MIIYTEYTIFKARSRRRSVSLFKVSDGNIKIKGHNCDSTKNLFQFCVC